MTTLAANDESVHCLSVQGTFDDAQAIVKDLFVDKDFQADFQLGAVNSINFARILAQIVYYFSAYVYIIDVRNLERKVLNNSNIVTDTIKSQNRTMKSSILWYLLEILVTFWPDFMLN